MERTRGMALYDNYMTRYCTSAQHTARRARERRPFLVTGAVAFCGHLGPTTSARSCSMNVESSTRIVTLSHTPQAAGPCWQEAPAVVPRLKLLRKPIRRRETVPAPPSPAIPAPALTCPTSHLHRTIYSIVQLKHSSTPDITMYVDSNSAAHRLLAS